MGGKSDAPAAPDYIGQANASAAGNLNAARAQTAGNRIDQATPYGSIKYTQGDGFDEEGYNAAVEKYTGMQRLLDENPNGSAMRQYMAAIGQTPTSPNRNDYIKNPDHWASQIELSETGQQLLDADSRARLGMADLQGSAMDRVRSALGSDFDMSGLQDMQTNVDPATGMAAWDRATDLVRQRQNPELDRQQQTLDTKLANMGLTAGSEGWATQQQQFGKTRNDADIAAQMAGLQAQQQFFGQSLQNAGLKNGSRMQQVQERSMLRQLPMNELNALRTGAQVQNPTFSTPGQQGQTSGPDLLGASQSQYTSAMNNVNAQNAQSAGNAQAGVGLVAALASMY